MEADFKGTVGGQDALSSRDGGTQSSRQPSLLTASPDYCQDLMQMSGKLEMNASKITHTKRQLRQVTLPNLIDLNVFSMQNIMCSTCIKAMNCLASSPIHLIHNELVLLARKFF